MLVFKLISVVVAVSALLALTATSEAAPKVRDHRTSSSTGVQINSPPNVRKDTNQPDRSNGGVSVSPAKNQRVYRNKAGQPVFRRCGGAGHPC
jgi:hypothetical protein